MHHACRLSYFPAVSSVPKTDQTLKTVNKVKSIVYENNLQLMTWLYQIEIDVIGLHIRILKLYNS